MKDIIEFVNVQALTTQMITQLAEFLPRLLAAFAIDIAAGDIRRAAQGQSARSRHYDGYEHFDSSGFPRLAATPATAVDGSRPTRAVAQ